MSIEHITDERLAEVLTEAYGSPEWTMADVRAARAVEAASLAQRPAAQPAGEPVYWEWRHLSTHPDTIDFGQWSEWERVERRSALDTVEDTLAEFRAYIAQGYKYELRALYPTPQPVAVPDRVPMTEEQISDVCDESSALGIVAFLHGVRAAEAHHGITTPKADK